MTDAIAPDFSELADEADHTTVNPMEIISVADASEFDGWIVRANKVRGEWIRAVEDAGYRVGTISSASKGNVRVMVR